jgi:hypothetical protein
VGATSATGGATRTSTGASVTIDGRDSRKIGVRIGASGFDSRKEISGVFETRGASSTPGAGIVGAIAGGGTVVRVDASGGGGRDEGDEGSSTIAALSMLMATEVLGVGGSGPDLGRVRGIVTVGTAPGGSTDTRAIKR